MGLGVVDREHGGRRRPDAASGHAGPVAEHGAPHQVGPGPRDQQGDICPEATPQHRARPEVGEGKIGVAHQHLGRVAATLRDGRPPVAGEVERPHGAGPGSGGRVAGRGRLAEAVEEQQRRGRAGARLAGRHRVERQAHRVVLEPHDAVGGRVALGLVFGCVEPAHGAPIRSSTSPATSSGCSMCTK